MPLSEKAIRNQLIDKALLSSGWDPITRAGLERQRALAALEEYPTSNDTQAASAEALTTSTAITFLLCIPPMGS